jgi:hypothetical protein
VEQVATVAFLVEAGNRDVDLGPEVGERLAGLGVTSVALFRDPETLCLVLEGWAFDPSSAATAAAVIGIGPGARTLRPVMETALRATG